MIPSIRQQYNQQFSKEKYHEFLDDLNQTYQHKITFRVAETPVFVGKEFEVLLQKASGEIIDFLVRDDFKKLTEAAIPKKLFVPNETDHTLFLALDFGVISIDGKAEPRLIEMQGFPSLFGWQDVLAEKYRKHFFVPPNMQSHFGLSSTDYRATLKKALLGGHRPEEVVLLEIDPLQQNTAIDFLATQDITGVAPIHLGDVIREEKKLFLRKRGQEGSNQANLQPCDF